MERQRHAHLKRKEVLSFSSRNSLASSSSSFTFSSSFAFPSPLCFSASSQFLKSFKQPPCLFPLSFILLLFLFFYLFSPPFSSSSPLSSSSYSFFVYVSALGRDGYRRSVHPSLCSGTSSFCGSSSSLPLSSLSFSSSRKQNSGETVWTRSSPNISRHTQESSSPSRASLHDGSSLCSRGLQQGGRRARDEKHGEKESMNRRQEKSSLLSISLTRKRRTGHTPGLAFLSSSPPAPFSSSSSFLSTSSPSSFLLSSSYSHPLHLTSRHLSSSSSSSRLSFPYHSPQPFTRSLRNYEERRFIFLPESRDLLLLFSSSSSTSSSPPRTAIGLNVSTVEEVLESIRPYLRSHGGNVKLIRVDSQAQVVYLAFKGACLGCPSSNRTLYEGIQTALQEVFGTSLSVEEVADHTWEEEEEPLTKERVEEALQGIKPAIEKLNATLEVLSISDGGDLQIRYTGPNAQTIRIGIEMELRDKLPPDLLGSIDITAEEKPSKISSSSPSQQDTSKEKETYNEDMDMHAKRKEQPKEKEEEKEDHSSSSSRSPGSVVHNSQDPSRTSYLQYLHRNANSNEVEDDEEEEDSLEPEPA